METKQKKTTCNMMPAYFFITLALFFSNGNFSTLSFFLLTSGILSLFLPGHVLTLSRKSEMHFLRGMLVLFTLMMLVKMNWFFLIYPVAFEKFRHLHTVYTPGGKLFLLLLTSLLSAASLLFAFMKPLKKNSLLFFSFISVLYVALMGLALCVFYDPPIDVYDMLMSAGHALRQHKNPYAMSFDNLYYSSRVKYLIQDPIYQNPALDFFSYFPGVFPFLMLGSLGGDARFLLVLFHFGFFIVLYMIANGSTRGALWGLLFLLNPACIYLLLHSYIEPLLVFTLALSLLCRLRRKTFWFAFLFGYMLSLKQYVVLLLPVFFKLGSKKTLIFSVMFFFIFVFPFFLWSPADLVRDSVLLPLKVLPREDGLTLWAFLNHLGIQPRGWRSFSLFIIGLFFIFPMKTKTPHDALLHAGRLYTLLFLFSNYAFINYYYFALSFIPLSQVLLEDANPMQKD